MGKAPQSRVHRHPIVYHCATPDPAKALLFGNGRVGGSVHTPDDSLYILVSRSDLWSEKASMGSMAALRLRDGTTLFSGAQSVRQVCDLAEAEIRISVETAAGQIELRLVCPREADVLLLDIEDRRSEPHPFSLAIENWHVGDETEPTATVHVNRTSEFVACNRRVKVDAAAVGLADPLLGRAWGLFTNAAAAPAGRRTRFVAAAVCEPPTTAGDAETEMRRRAAEWLARAEGEAEGWLTGHRQWWRRFWERSHIRLSSGTGDAEYEERLWYVNMYYLACAQGGKYPPRFNGATFLLDKDERAWEGGYWFQNMRELYWPLPASGHWEWMPGFFQMYFDAMPYVREQTKRIFGIDAPSYRETQSFWGWTPDTHLVAGRSNTGVHNYFSGNLEVCLLMDWYWRAAGDEPFLRDRFYPFLKEIIRFYRIYARKGDDGRYHLAPVNALETWTNAKDPMPDIAGLRYLLPRLIEWGERFGEEAAALCDWREFLENLAPIPIGRWTVTRQYQGGIHEEVWHIASEPDPDGLFLPAADKTVDKMPRSNMENAELYIVFPWGLLGAEAPEAELRRFENTWNHRTWRLVNNGWAQDVPQLARMGWAEQARAVSLEHASYNQRFPNGAFISPAGPHFHGLLTSTPFLDTAGVHLTGLQEMLLQSYDEVIRVCPAVSVEWSGEFKLHALGGFIVEARFTQGRATWAQITATRDATLRLRGLPERPMKSGETLTFGDTAAGRELPDESLPDVIYPGYKIHPPLAAHSTGHWHDERQGHGQVGLDVDGLFPAIRCPDRHDLLKSTSKGANTGKAT